MVNTVFPIIMYILGSTLLVVLIILVLKLIYTVDRTNEILDDVQVKIRTLDGLFNAIDTASSTIANISDTILDKFFGFLAKFTKKKKKNKIRKEEEEYFDE